ncbi:ABC transporter permease subunit [Bradyrhizobium sp. I1.7.5]|uniref:ABC transporter permease n=1 Tax=Bradyrhizobium sp. I1.7.5 TaxID=3156363 RepID=UPI00339A9BD7
MAEQPPSPLRLAVCYGPDLAIQPGLRSDRPIGTEIGVVLAHSIGAIAYVVIIVAAMLSNFDQRLEQAAKSMRAGPIRTFVRVTLPLIRPGIIGGGLFAFISSFDEVVTSFVSGFSFRTLPLKMLENMNQQVERESRASVHDFSIARQYLTVSSVVGTSKSSDAPKVGVWTPD